MPSFMNDPSVWPFIFGSKGEDMDNYIYCPTCHMLMEGTGMITLAQMFSQHISEAVLYLLYGVIEEIHS